MNQERMFVLILSATHGLQHFLGRIFPPLIPLLATDLQLPLWKLGLVVTLWSFSVGLGQTPMGHLSDRLDRRYLLPTGLLVVGIGYLIVSGTTMFGAWFPTITLFGVTLEGTLQVMLLGMIVAGLGKSVTHPVGYPLISANVAEDRKGKALGRWGSAAKLGDAVSPAVVAVAIIFLPWQTVFALISLLAFGHAAVLFQFLARRAVNTVPAGMDPETDTENDQTEEGYLLTLLLLLATVAAAAVATRGIGTYLPVFVTDVYSFTFTVFGFTIRPESVASLYLSIVLLAGAAATLFVGNVTDRHNPVHVLAILFTGATAALFMLAFLPLTPATLLVISVLVGATLFAFGPARDGMITAVTPESREGRTFGYFWTAFLFITASYPVIIGYISDVAGIQYAFALLGIATALTLIPLTLLHLTGNGNQ